MQEVMTLLLHMAKNLGHKACNTYVSRNRYQGLVFVYILNLQPQYIVIFVPCFIRIKKKTRHCEKLTISIYTCVQTM